MSSEDREALLRDVMDSHDEAARFREDSLARGLAHLRARRRQRQVARVSAVVAVGIAGIILALRNRVSTNPTLATAPLPSPQKSRVEYINDEQLLALFPNRPVALIGPPGHQQLVFLDNHKAADRQ